MTINESNTIPGSKSMEKVKRTLSNLEKPMLWQPENGSSLSGGGGGEMGQTLTDLAEIWLVYSVYIRDELVKWAEWSEKKTPRKQSQLKLVMDIGNIFIWILQKQSQSVHHS